MTRYRRRPSGLLVPDHEVRGFRGSRVGGFSGIARGSSAGATVASLPVLTAIDPSSGDTAGGGTLTCWGTGFQSADVIRIDSSNQSTTFVNSGKLTCTIPAHAAGSVNVVVRRGVSDSNTMTFEFTAGGSVALLMATDWGQGTGTTDAILRNTAKTVPWDTVSSTAGGLEVIATGGLGFPTVNCLRAQWNIPPGLAGLQITTLPAIAVGEHRYYRLYHIFSVDTTNPGNWAHPIESTQTDPNSWVFNVADKDADGWNFRFLADQTAAPDTQWQLAVSKDNYIELAKDTVYRIEWHVHYESTGPDVWRLEVRIYDVNDALLYSNANFYNTGNGAAARTLADNPTLSMTALDLRTVDFTNRSGAGSWDFVTSTEYSYYAGWAIGAEDWCGPYVSGEDAT